MCCARVSVLMSLFQFIGQCSPRSVVLVFMLSDLFCSKGGKISYIMKSSYQSITPARSAKHKLANSLWKLIKKGKIEVFATGNLPGNLAIFIRKYLQKSGKEKDF